MTQGMINENPFARINSFSGRNSTENSSDDGEPFTIPIYVVALVVVGVITIATCAFCFFCVPSKNKRKIYAMMQEAKLEDDGT